MAIIVHGITTMTTTNTAAPSVTRPRQYRFTVADYYRMATAGVFGPDERLELLNGEVFEMSPIGQTHAALVDRINEWLVSSLQGKAIVRVQNPLPISKFSEPVPDFSIVRRREDYYADGKPGPADVLWLIEVSDSTLVMDRDVKLPLYARAKIAEVWIIDVQGRTIEVYSEPRSNGTYALHRTLRGNERIAPVALSSMTTTFRKLTGLTD